MVNANWSMYSIPMSSEAPSQRITGRERLKRVLRGPGELISIASVSAALALDRSAAAKLLARWNEQGWVKRVRRGTYAAVPISAFGQEQVLEDPWVVVPALFDPAA